MIPNAINTILGIILVYCAVLEPNRTGEASGLLAVGGVLISGLAFWARRADRIKWFNVVNMCMGITLLVVAVWHAASPLHALVRFWSLFWIGTTVSLFALWMLLYNRERVLT